MRLEISLIFLATLATIKILYQFRHLPGIRHNLLLGVALLLLYVPFFHNRLRRLSLTFFETDIVRLLRSLKIFLVTSLLLFPPFLVANHFYQQGLGNSFSLQPLNNTPSLFFSQLLLTALPEEFFFRGWLQPLIGGWLRQRPPRTPQRGALGRSESDPRAQYLAILLTALLFAFSHSFIALQWWHFAIFFPACVFGWLREKTGAITAPVLFHTVSNLLAAWMGVCYR